MKNTDKYMHAEKLLEELFHPESRPSVAWLDEQITKRTIPFVKVGGLTFFNPLAVRQHLDNQFRVPWSGENTTPLFGWKDSQKTPESSTIGKKPRKTKRSTKAGNSIP